MSQMFVIYVIDKYLGICYIICIVADGVRRSDMVRGAFDLVVSPTSFCFYFLTFVLPLGWRKTIFQRGLPCHLPLYTFIVVPNVSVCIRMILSVAFRAFVPSASNIKISMLAAPAQSIIP